MIDRLLRMSAVFLGTLGMLLAFAHPQWWIRAMGVLAFLIGITATVIAYRATTKHE